MSMEKKRGRGVLALLDGPPLPSYPYDANVLQETTHAMRQRRHCKPNVFSTFAQDLSATCEWTLFFLGDSKNLNSIRFRLILVDFVQRTSDFCQCICLPNREHEQDLLCGGTGFFCLPWSHENRTGVLR